MGVGSSIELIGLTKRFGDNTAVNGINLNMQLGVAGVSEAGAHGLCTTSSTRYC